MATKSKTGLESGRVLSERSRVENPVRPVPDRFEEWIESAIAYVPAVARRYVGCGLPFDELMASGNVGLVEAALRYDPERNVRFVTYADWWIRKTILKAIQEQSGAVRLPRYRLERMRCLRELGAELRSLHGSEPTAEQLAEAGGLSVAEVRRLQSTEYGSISLDQPVSRGTTRSLADSLAGDSAESDPESVIREDYADHVRRLLVDLAPKERLILVLRFGFLGTEPMTLREVGRRLGLSRERVRQIERQALLRLRERLTR